LKLSKLETDPDNTDRELEHYLFSLNDKILNINKDYIYGTVFGQLLQENINTAAYLNTTDWINPTATEREALLASGQGGPYQINDYSKRLENDQGLGLVNFVALQKGLGYTVVAQDNGTQTNLRGPDSLDQKYFGPMAAAYFHLNDMNRLAMNNADTWGPQYAYYASCMANLHDARASQNKYNIYDMILNAAYNAGTYSTIIRDYFRICAGMYNGNPEGLQIAALGDYTLSDKAYQAAIGTNEAAGSTFILYPRQVRLYLDQIYNQKTFNSPAISGNVSVRLSIQDIEYVFQNALGTLAYVDANNHYDYITPLQAKQAFETAMAQTHVSIADFVDLGKVDGKNQFFNLLDVALNNLATNLKMNFGAITQTTLGGVTPSPTPTATPMPSPTPEPKRCPSNPQIYPDGIGNYTAQSIVKAADGKFYQCKSWPYTAWCNSSATAAYAPGSGSSWADAWSTYDCQK